ncbi:MAG: hypothetical protein NVSMB51_14480 [Solirubrobacteraceae bacterium]
MYQFSRGIYRELSPLVDRGPSGRAKVLKACEATVERLAGDRHYFANPSRTLFNDIRGNFPVSAQSRVLGVVSRYMRLADRFLAEQPRNGVDANGEPLQCRAMTRRGTACRRMPLPHNGYCPSHQHLADTEDAEAMLAA